jgi:hypothetical protein
VEGIGKMVPKRREVCIARCYALIKLALTVTIALGFDLGFSRLIEVFVKPSSPSKPGPLEAVEDQVSSEQMQEPSAKKEKRKKKRERERDGTEGEKSKKATIS